FQAHHQFVAMAELAAIVPDLPVLPASFTTFQYDDRDVEAIARWMRGGEVGFHLPRILMKVDRASMYHALEVRMPLLDREVLDVASRVDWRSCLDVQARIGKRPLRVALARRVSHQTVAKRGFTVPMDRWLRGALRPLFEDVMLARRDLVGLRLDQAALGATFRRHLDGDTQQGWLLWRLLALALWEDRHGHTSPAA
ncbi:MAG TPA: asparagine synthase-related protein, partial [Gemmatimonadaceae bacterium]|nr:asparagine synthase-related protein [Gemmatimonadaceae bacterium]